MQVGLLARGSSPRSAFPGSTMPSGSFGRGSPLTVAGAAAASVQARQTNRVPVVHPIARTDHLHRCRDQMRAELSCQVCGPRRELCEAFQTALWAMSQLSSVPCLVPLFHPNKKYRYIIYLKYVVEVFIASCMSDLFRNETAHCRFPVTGDGAIADASVEYHHLRSAADRASRFV